MMEPDEIIVTKVANGWLVTAMEGGEDAVQFVVPRASLGAMNKALLELEAEVKSYVNNDLDL